MRGALREVPDVTKAKLLNLVPAKFIHGTYEHSTSVDDSPLSLKQGQHTIWVVVRRCTYNAMPVKFASRALFQMLLSTGDIMTGGEIRDDLLSDPAALEKPGLGIGEAPLQVRHHAVICGLLAEVVRVL